MTDLIITRFNASTDSYSYDEKHETFFSHHRYNNPDRYYSNLVPDFSQYKEFDKKSKFRKIFSAFTKPTSLENYVNADRAFCKNLGIYTINFLEDCPFMASDSYHGWVEKWKTHYAVLSEWIRFLKDSRKQKARARLGAKSEYEIQVIINNMKVLANRMLLARWKYKQLRRVYKEGAQTSK